MNKSKNKVLLSTVIAIIGAFVLTLSVLVIHNKIITDNQIKNNHEKLVLIDRMIQQSKEDEEEITSVYDEMYQSKVDTIAFELENLDEINYTDAYAEELRNAFDVNYLSISDTDISIQAGERSEEEESYKTYTTTSSNGKTITIQESLESLQNNLHQNASLYHVLSNVHVGQNGYALAVNSEDGSIIYSPNADEIGQQASEHDIDVSKLVDGNDISLTIDGVEYLGSCKQIDDGLIVTVVPQSEMNANDLHTILISLIIYGIFIAIIILYATFLHEEVMNEEEDEEEAKKKLNKKLGGLFIVAIVLSFGVTFYMQTLFTLSQQSITNNARLEELKETLETNENSIEVQEEEYNDQYSAKLSEASYILSHVDSTKLTKSFMTELKDVLKVNSVMYFDTTGHVIAANTDNWSYSISKDEEDQSYEFWDILNGEKTEIIQKVTTNVNGNLRQYMARSVQDSTYHTVGMVTFSATPSALSNALINTDDATVLKGISTGNKGFAFAVTKPTEEEESTFVYFPKDTLIGKSCLKNGLKETQLVGEYNDFLTVNNSNYYCASSVYEDMIVYIAVPMSSLNITAVPVACVTTVVMMVFMLILWNLYRKENYEDASSQVMKENAEQVDVDMGNGRTAKARTVGFRWTHDDISWNAMTAGQKTSEVVNVVLTLLAFIVLILVCFADKFFSDDSLIHFILSGKWQRGVNIFAITYCVLIVICVTEVSLIVRRIIMWVAHSLNAKGETICRLVDNFIKFATFICLFYFALSTFGVDTSTLVTSAGILTLVVGLGAQSLVSDVLAGLFIVFESTFQVGDIVTIGGVTGSVVEIGVRTTKVLTDGNMKIFSNSSVKDILNMTQDYSNVNVDIQLESTDKLLDVESMLRKTLPEIAKRIQSIAVGPSYKGVILLPDTNSVTIRITAKCMEGNRAQVYSDLMRQLKLAFDTYHEEKQKEALAQAHAMVKEQAEVEAQAKVEAEAKVQAAE